MTNEVKAYQRNLYYIARRCLYICLCVCMFAAYLLRNGWTDLAEIFFVSSVLGQLRFQAKKIPDPGSGFSGNPEKVPQNGTIKRVRGLRFCIVTSLNAQKEWRQGFGANLNFCRKSKIKGGHLSVKLTQDEWFREKKNKTCSRIPGFSGFSPLLPPKGAKGGSKTPPN